MVLNCLTKTSTIFQSTSKADDFCCDSRFGVNFIGLHMLACIV